MYRFDGISLAELAATPATPGSGLAHVYAKSDGNLYWKNDAGTELAVIATTSGTVGTPQIADGAVTTAKMATDPYARANHTGTQLASTISNFDTQVRTSRLDQMAAPTGMLNVADITAAHVRITSVGDADLTTTDHGFQIGPDNGYNLAMDAGQSGGWCELQTRDGAGGPGSPLALNARGGDVILGDATSTLTVTGAVTMPARPKGLVAAWTISANTNTVTTTAERVMLTWSFTAEASRSYRVVLSGGLVDSESTVAQSAYCALRWQQGSAVTTTSAGCGRQIVATPASTNGDLASGVHVEGLITTATAGTVNVGFTVTAANGANGVRYFATGIPTRVYVEDMGPSVTVNTLTFV